MSAMDEVFGHMGARPDTAEFWRLSEMILQLDGRMDAARTTDEKDRVFEETVGAHVGMQELSYMALQRAIRYLGISTKTELVAHMAEAMKLTAFYMDAFTAGAEWETRKQ